MEQQYNKNIFITGITGFTGKYLENNLNDLGFSVFGTTTLKPISKKHFNCDILNEEDLYNVLSVVKPNFIIHLAALSFVATTDEKSFYDVNVFGTLNLFKAIERLEYTPDKVLIASSAAVYGNIEGELNEEMCPQPVNHYGNSKLVMENMVQQYYDNQNIIIVRPFNYTGIGQPNRFLIPKIVKHFKLQEKEIELGNIDVYREFNDVDFVVDVYIKLLLSDLKSEIFNVCSGNVYNIKKILLIMNKIAGYKIVDKINPLFVRENEIKILRGSTKKLFLSLNIVPENFSLENLLQKMFLS